MYLSRKKKLILAWSIPAAIAVVGVATVAPIIIVNENNKYSTINNAPKISPISFNKLEENYLASLQYNPAKYDVNFFTYNLGITHFVNDIFAFKENNQLLQKKITADKSGQILDIFWTNSEGVVYKIENLQCVSDLTIPQDNYVFNLEITKSYKNVVRKYTEKVTIPSSSFASKEESLKSFLTNSAEKLNQMLLTEEITFKLSTTKVDQIASIVDITSSNDLMLDLNQGQYGSFRSSTSNGQVTYQSDSSYFKYLGKNVIINTPISDGTTKMIWESKDAYSFNGSTFNTSGGLYTFLLNEYKAGNLLYLPNLSNEESSNLTEDQILQARIQKLIFDSSILPSSWDSNSNLVPLSDYQAILVKLTLEGQTTYVVLWTNLFSTGTSVVDKAPELKMQITKKNSKLLTYSEVVLPTNYKFISTITAPEKNLVYTVKEVSFSADDTYKTKALVKVVVSHPSLSTTKTYTTTVTTGFLSQAYISLESQIKALMGATDSVAKLAPGLALKGVSVQEFKNLDMSKVDKIQQKLTITPPSGLTSAYYTLVSGRIDGDKFIGTFKLSSQNDMQNYWNNEGTIQYISATLNLVSRIT